MIQAAALPFVQARWFTKGTPDQRKYDLIVVHTMEAPDKGNTAENVANYFATTDTKASAHYCIDSDSIVHCVQESDVAYGAPGANHNGIHLEHAGYSVQTVADWHNAYNKLMLARSAELCADICKRRGIPPVWLYPPDILAGKRGITSHWCVTRAGRLDPHSAYAKGTHTDPGLWFPWNEYVARVAALLKE